MRVLPLKSHFLMAVLVFLAMCFMVQKGFIYTIAVFFLCFSLRILLHFALRFVAF